MHRLRNLLLRPYTFYWLAAVAFIPVLLNLAFIPVAWVDEIGYLDPAVNLAANGHYASSIWNIAGTSEVFAAHLPLLMWIHTAGVWLTGPDIFLVRLYEVVLGLICLIFFRRILFKLYPGLNPWILLTLPFLLLFDQVFYESLRSVRMEIISCTLLVIFIDAYLDRRRYGLQALCLALLCLTHPAMWSAALAGSIMLLIQLRQVRSNTVTWSFLLFILPFILFLYSIHFNINALVSQLFSHGSDHSEAAISGNLLVKHFWLRFCDYTHGAHHFNTYFQPFHPLLNILCLGFAVYDLTRRRSMHILPWLIIAVNLYWLFALAPFRRYLPPLILLNYLYLPRLAATLTRQSLRKAALWVYGLAVSTAIAYFAGINLFAFVQRPYRDPYAAQRWIQQHISGSPGNKALLAGEAIGYYAVAGTDVDFYAAGLSDLTQYRASYEQIFLLTYKKLPEKELGIYLPSGNAFSQRLVEKGTTYYGLHLYALPDMLTLRKYVDRN